MIVNIFGTYRQGKSMLAKNIMSLHPDYIIMEFHHFNQSYMMNYKKINKVVTKDSICFIVMRDQIDLNKKIYEDIYSDNKFLIKNVNNQKTIKNRK